MHWKIEEDVQENNAAMVETKERLLGALDSYNEKKFELSKCKRYKKWQKMIIMSYMKLLEATMRV